MKAIFKISTLLLVATGAIAVANESFTEAERLFTLKVQPLFSEKCNGCHGDDPEKIKSGFNMLTREQLLAGGDEFGDTVLVPGDAERSFLVETIKWADPDWEMPPKETDRFTDEQVELVEAWIDAGAPWPNEETMSAIREAESKKEVTEDGVIVPTSGGLGDDWTYRRYQPEDIWAFQPVKKPLLRQGYEGQAVLNQAPNPVSRAKPWRSPIDSILNAKLEAAGFAPAERADTRTLIRRATYDLTGLPPTPEEVSAFEKANDADPAKAWTDLIDRLLASPHYGERWAQHWLDVARYADTGGMSNDYERSNAWRYRDYVIRAFNEDKPYDQFVIEQLAGDELADASVKKRGADPKKAREEGGYTEAEAEQIVATGFLRMGPYDDAMVKKPEARQIYLDDVVNGVGQTFLSTTMRCFKCHDHKFDPLPTRDYYRMYSAFSTTWMAERPVPFLPSENLDGFDEGKAHVEGMHAYATREMNKLRDKRETAAKKWYQENGIDYVAYDERKDLPDEMKPARHVGLDTTEQGQLKVREQDDWIWNRRKERYEPMAQSVYNGKKQQGNARKLRLHEHPYGGDDVENFILSGGALEAKGEPVTPGVISSLGVPVRGAKKDDPWALPTSIEGRRLALAQWIADPRNPLTVRSIVNRVWQGHFVNPVARNPNNFGVKGAKPSHPELLDFLAADFVENGWSFKKLHRQIMLSDAYQRSSTHYELDDLAAKDPFNAWLAYYPARRLTAEELRDSFLLATGELNDDMGGLPIMPEINMEVALQPRMIQFSLAPAYQPSPTPEERNRRTIYAYRVRGMADPFLELFNQPNPNDSCEMRDSAAVTPQAFTLLNSDMITDRSIAMAERLGSEASDLDAQIESAFQIVLGRKPDGIELKRLKEYAAEMVDYHRTATPDRPEYPTTITRSLVEEFSGDSFEYEEILPYFEDYQPDKKASDVDAETRALADVCMLLFNANEFVFVY